MATYKIISVYDGEYSNSGTVTLNDLEHHTIEQFAKLVFYALAPPGYDEDEFDYFTVEEKEYSPTADVIVWQMEIEGDESIEVAVKLPAC